MSLKSLFRKFAGRKEIEMQSSNIRVETPRLVLREIEMSDEQRLLEISNTPGFAHYCFDGSKEKVDTFLKKCLDGRKPDPEVGLRNNIMLGIELKETGEFIGCVSIEDKSFVDGIDYEVNFFVDAKKQNGGYGREAAVNLMRYAFEDMKLPAINVTIEPDNVPSLRVAHTEGYVDTGKEVDIKTPCFGTRTFKVLVLSKEAFYEQRLKDKKALLLPRQETEKQPEKKRRFFGWPK